MIVTLRHEVPAPSGRTGPAVMRFHLNMHAGASIIHVAEVSARLDKGKPVYETYLWAIEDTTMPVERRDFRYVRDGERMDWAGDDASWRHVATFVSVSGHIWQHIYETTGLVVDVVQDGGPRRPTTGVAEPALLPTSASGVDG